MVMLLSGFWTGIYHTKLQRCAGESLGKGTKPYPHVARGGSFHDQIPLKLPVPLGFFRPSMETADPQLPKSIWYLTDAVFLGMRIVRPLKFHQRRNEDLLE